MRLSFSRVSHCALFGNCSPPSGAAAADANGGFDRRDVHVGVSRRGAMVIYNHELKEHVVDVEAQLKAEPRLATPLPSADATAREGGPGRPVVSDCRAGHVPYVEHCVIYKKLVWAVLFGIRRSRPQWFWTIFASCEPRPVH